MATNVVNQVAFLRTSREFPETDIHMLALEVNKTYVDTAAAVNARTIGIFPVRLPAITGESWFLSGARRQQTLRQVYQFTSTASIAHGINFGQISGFSRLFGAFYNDINNQWYGLIPGSNVAIAGQVSFYVDPTNINFLSGAGAPAVTKGTVVLEWLSDV